MLRQDLSPSPGCQAAAGSEQQHSGQHHCGNAAAGWPPGRDGPVDCVCASTVQQMRNREAPGCRCGDPGLDPWWLHLTTQSWKLPTGPVVSCVWQPIPSTKFFCLDLSQGTKRLAYMSTGNVCDRQDEVAVHQVTRPAGSSRCLMCQSTATLQPFQATCHQQQHKLDMYMETRWSTRQYLPNVAALCHDS